MLDTVGVWACWQMYSSGCILVSVPIPAAICEPGPSHTHSHIQHIKVLISDWRFRADHNPGADTALHSHSIPPLLYPVSDVSGRSSTKPQKGEGISPHGLNTYRLNTQPSRQSHTHTHRKQTISAVACDLCKWATTSITDTSGHLNKNKHASSLNIAFYFSLILSIAQL